MLFLTSAPSPYQVLRVLNAESGMVKSGVRLVGETASVTYWRPDKSPIERVPVGTLSFASSVCTLAVYSMAWSVQLEPARPKLLASDITKTGGDSTE